jgi:glycosyltransferase involved in cell wall biosynthesis
MDGSSFGGAHTFLFKVMEGLHERGIEVHFITKGKLVARTALYIETSGVHFHNNLWPESILVEDAAPVLAEWMETLNPDVYVVSVSPDIGWIVLPYLAPHIATCSIGHNDSQTFYDPARHYGDFLTKAIGVSKEICNNYISKSGIDEEKVTWIPYGVESDKTGPSRGDLNGSQPLSLVYVGRLEEEQKRSSDLIRIIHLLAEKQINFHFKVIGDGPLFPEFEKQLAPEIARGRVQLTGWLKNDEMMKHLCQSDVFVLTSAYEGFCISLVEAMANGCCPVVTNIDSGNKQLVANGINGFLIPVGDIAGFAEKIELLSSQPSVLFELRQKSWEIGKSYSVARMVDAYYDCFIKAIAEAQRNPRQRDPSFPLMESCRSKYPSWLRKIKLRAQALLR